MRNNWLPILPLNVVMLILFNQFIYFHSFINLSVKCLCDTLTIHTRKNMHLFQLRQFAKNFLRIKIILVSHLSLTKKIGKVCWQSNDKATSKTPLQDLYYLKHEIAALLSCPSTCSFIFSFQ